MKLVMATPPPYQYNEEALAWIRGQVPSLDLTVTTDPVEAVCDAVAIYTDVWASMGQEHEREVRRRDFAVRRHRHVDENERQFRLLNSDSWLPVVQVVAIYLPCARQ